MRWFRPDSNLVLRDPIVKNSLKRYFAVMNDEQESYFIRSKYVTVDVDLSDDLDALLKEHDKKVNEVKKVSGEEIPKISLLDLKIEIARRILHECEFCERKCKKNRYEKKGFCKVGVKPIVSSIFDHWGEEPELVPSGTVFFCGCTFFCVYCQNWTIARIKEGGRSINAEDLALRLEQMRSQGIRNVNWVGGDPTPHLHYILETMHHLDVNIPSVWNSNMYLSQLGMNLLNGVVDVYLTDFKYGNNECARRLSKVKNYWEIITRNHLIASEQCELIIRHLVLPNHVECCTYPILDWISKNLRKDVRLNIMPQYRPEFIAYKYDELVRRVTGEEMRRAKERAIELGLNNLVR
ncbi:MAG: radical SAM protein [Candidatus Hydrothermarchaeota archaeon]